MKIIYRVGRHETTPSHRAALIAVFGDDIRIIAKDVRYGDDAVAAVARAIREYEMLMASASSGDARVIAVEAAGPEPVLMQLVKGLAVPVIRPVFRRDGTRVAIAGKDAGGRDVFDVEHYERLEVEVRPTIVGRAI